MTTRSKGARAAEKITKDAMTAALKLVTTATETASRLAQSASDTAGHLRTHEAVCVERYDGLRGDIAGVELKIVELKKMIIVAGGIAVGGTGALIVALASVAWAFLKKELHLG